MILEDATKEAFGYYASEVRPESKNQIIASCELCGRFRSVVRYGYRTFCFSCLEILKGSLKKGNCIDCNREFDISKGQLRKIKGKYYCKKCYADAQSRMSIGKAKATARKLGYMLLLSVKVGEDEHHITDKYVIGISKEVHVKLSDPDREKHRAKVLEWLKTNDQKKYKKALSVLKSKSL